MDLIWTIIIGFLVGLVARFIKPGDEGMGFIATTFVGIIGAFAGSYLGQAMGIYHAGETAGFIGSVVGAIVVLAVLKLIFGKR